MEHHEIKIDVTNINQKVYEILKRRIITLVYLPGHKLNVLKIRQELGVSQSPIMDALFRLAGENMVEISSRRGTYVKEITELDIREIATVRIMLEVGAVEIIAEHITDEQIGELRRLYNETLIQGPEFDYDLYMEKDKAFHLAIIRFTGNQRLISMYDQLNAHMQIVRFRFARQSKTKLSWTDEDHQNILNTLQGRNPEKAKEAIRKHLLRARDAFLQSERQAL